MITLICTIYVNIIYPYISWRSSIEIKVSKVYKEIELAKVDGVGGGPPKFGFECLNNVCMNNVCMNV